MRYNAYYVKIEPLMPARELMYAVCQDHPVETVQDTDEGLVAFIPFDDDDGAFAEALKDFPLPEVSISYELKEFAPTNWNLLWEENFEPIEVDKLVRVRASFHDADERFPHEILIDPKMSFGTGHHQTTWLMLKVLSDINCENKSVLDMGCGTGILGIYTGMKGAKPILGIDIEAWAAENSRENAEKNGIDMEVRYGGVEQVEGNFDMIIANINRNVLLEQLPMYFNHLNKGGDLLLSGFYNTNEPEIKERALEVGFTFTSAAEKEDWMVLRFNK